MEMLAIRKTLTTIAVEGALYFHAGRIRRVLVVSPLSVTGVWKDEHDAQHADFDNACCTQREWCKGL